MITLITNGHPLSEASIRSLKAYLERDGIPVRAIFLSHSLWLYPALIRDIVEMVRDSVLVGFSLMSKDVRIVRPLMAQVRRRGVPVVLGGVHATALPGQSLALADYICRGEGEEPLRQLYHALCGSGAVGRIPNLGYHGDSGPVIQPVSWSPQDLDRLPPPDSRMLNTYLLTTYRQGRRLVKIPADSTARARLLGGKGFMLYSQRGCRLACAFCSNSLYRDLLARTGQRWYRTLSVERVKAYLRSHQANLPWVRHITINDDDFLDRDIDQLRQIGEFLRDDLGWTFNINATPRHITAEKIDLLVACGLREVAMGVQTGSERVLKEIYHRPVPPQDILRSARILDRYRDRGVKVCYGFILDNPWETCDDWLASFRLLNALPRPRDIMLYSLAMFPGTRLTRRACREGLIPGPEVDCDKMYHDDIQPHYAWFLFLLHRRWQIPERLGRLLTARWVVAGALGAPWRWLCGRAVYLLTLRPRLGRICKRLYDQACRLRASSLADPADGTRLDPLPEGQAKPEIGPAQTRLCHRSDFPAPDRVASAVSSSGDMRADSTMPEVKTP